MINGLIYAVYVAGRDPDGKERGDFYDRIYEKTGTSLGSSDLLQGERQGRA